MRLTAQRLTAYPLTASSLTGVRVGEAIAGFNPVSLSPAAFFDFSRMSTLFQDAAGTIPVTAVGQPVGRANDLSGNGNNATQSTATARPIWSRQPEGGVRNLINNSDSIESDSGWIITDGATSVLATKMQNAVSQTYLITNGTQAFSRAQKDINLLASTQYVCQIKVKTSDTTRSRLGVFDAGGSAWQGYVDVDWSGGVPSTNSSVGATSITYDNLGNSEYLVSFVFTTGTPLTDTQYHIQPDRTNAGGSIFLSDPQVELGSTATPYQKVVSEYDITEAGVPSVFYPKDDATDDALTATLPDLGTAATRAVVNLDGTVTYLEGQTINGATDIPLDCRAVLYRATAFTTAEKADLEAWAA